MSRLVLVRHGQTTSNVAGALDTALPGASLTALGREQAAEVGRELAAEGVAPPVVSSSEADRARQTAQIVADVLGVPSETVPGAFEVQAGEFEMRDDAEAIAAYDSVLVGWLARDEREGSLPGGESLVQVGERVLPLVAGLRSGALTEGDVVLVVHGTLMRLIAVLCGAVPPVFALENRIPNCGRIELEPVDAPASPTESSAQGQLSTLDAGRWRCVRWASAQTPLTF